VLNSCEGKKHVDSQLANVVLQVIMQFVTVEVCASLIFPAASAPPVAPIMLVVSNRHIARGAIIHSLPQTVIGPESSRNALDHWRRAEDDK
jgi:hypothetical protein